MSWSLNATASSTDDVVVGDAVDAALAKLKTAYEESDYALSAESEAQIAAAKDVVVALVKSGKVGMGVSVNIAMSGHANPDHKPLAGYGPDYISVSVTQAAAASS